MNRKRMSFCFLIFLLLSTVASGQQTATKADIKVLEAKISSLENTVREMDKRLSSQIKTLFWAIGALITIVLAVIVLPQLLAYYKDKQERADLRKMIKDLRQRYEDQQQEIEELRHKIVMPS